jgi:hypothetical protein
MGIMQNEAIIDAYDNWVNTPKPILKLKNKDIVASFMERAPEAKGLPLVLST